MRGSSSRRTTETLTATFVGRELGLVIGKHGQTIDAIQYLANAIVWRNRSDERKPVVVDAAGYRARRQSSLDALATRSAEQAVSLGPARRARADDRGRAQGRPRPPPGVTRA